MKKLRLDVATDLGLMMIIRQARRMTYNISLLPNVSFRCPDDPIRCFLIFALDVGSVLDVDLCDCVFNCAKHSGLWSGDSA